MGNYLIHSLFLFLHIMKKKLYLHLRGSKKSTNLPAEAEVKKMVNLVSLDQTELVFISLG